jgi:hypothetical protein
MSRAPFIVIANFTAGRTFLTCGVRNSPPPVPQRQANWRPRC